METEIKKHESYGMVGFSRVTCGGEGQTLFGSSIKHHNIITLTIMRAEKQRNLNEDWYHGTEELIEVSLSPSQFADCITSMNIGNGVPCTIEHVGMKRMADPPCESKQVQFRNEFSNDIKKIATKFDNLSKKIAEMKKSPTVRKGDVNELSDMIRQVRQDIECDIPFVNEQFARQMNKTTTEAKAEVEAFVSGTITKLGLNALKENVRERMPQLNEGETATYTPWIDEGICQSKDFRGICNSGYACDACPYNKKEDKK